MLTVSQKQNILKTRELFISHFNEEPTDFFKSCGRLEIIGNHVDYNGGSVINSSAGNLNILTSVKGSDDNLIVVKSDGYPDLVVDLNDIEYKDEEEEFKQKMSVKFALDQFIEVEPSDNPLAHFTVMDLGL